MVRQLVAGLDESRHTIDTLTFALTLLDDPSKTKIENLIRGSSTTMKSNTNPLGSCIEYSDDDAFGVAVFYCMWRNLICGIVQRILDRVARPVTRQYFDRDKIETEDVEVAQKIVKSIDFAFRPTSAPPFKAIRISTPMMVSYGAWNRLQKRHEKGSPDMLSQATKLKTIVCENFNRATGLWHVQSFAQEKAEQMCEAYSGGDIMPLLSRKR